MFRLNWLADDDDESASSAMIDSRVASMYESVLRCVGLSLSEKFFERV